MQPGKASAEHHGRYMDACGAACGHDIIQHMELIRCCIKAVASYSYVEDVQMTDDLGITNDTWNLRSLMDWSSSGDCWVLIDGRDTWGLLGNITWQIKTMDYAEGGEASWLGTHVLNIPLTMGLSLMTSNQCILRYCMFTDHSLWNWEEQTENPNACVDEWIEWPANYQWKCYSSHQQNAHHYSDCIIELKGSLCVHIAGMGG